MMNKNDFYTLQSNLSEIHAALHAGKSHDSLPLYAHSTHSVYYGENWGGMFLEKWDRMWRWIQSTEETPCVDEVIRTILTTTFNYAVHQAYDGRQRRIWNHMRQIDLLWKNKPSPVDSVKQREYYRQWLKKELKGSIEENKQIYLSDYDERKQHLLTSDEEAKHRGLIINFHQATLIFWSLFIKDNNKNLIEPLLKYVDSQSTLLDRPLFKALKKEGRWMQVEGVMQQSIPVLLIAKLCDPSNLKVDEVRCLTLWVKALNQHQELLSLKLLSVVFNEIIEIIRIQGNSTLTLQDFLFWLDQQACQILHSEDAAHMDWRESLQVGDKIECNGKQLVLGKQISPKKEIDDEFKIFELADKANWVVKIANNRFRLFIEERQSQSDREHWGIRLVEKIKNIEEDQAKSVVDGLDREGRCVVQEKLPAPFAAYEWTSQGMELNAKDEEMALILASHFFCMQQWHACPENLSLSHLLRDREGLLKSTRLLKKGAPNYHAWEAYCLDAAKGNQYVLNFLMKVSKLAEHKIGKYYRDAVAYTLKMGKIDLIGRPLPVGHHQKIYDKKVNELCEMALVMREACIKRITAILRAKGHYSYKEENELKNKIGKRLATLYCHSPTPGHLSSELLEEMVKSYFNDDGEDVLDDHEKYY